MALCPRARFIILENKAPIRDGAAARSTYNQVFAGYANAHYAGWISHKYAGSKPAHNYLLDNPTPEQIADLEKLASNGVIKGQVILERYQ